MSPLLALLGVVVEGLDGLVGLDCSPIVVGQDCSNTPVCCENSGDVSASNVGSTLPALTIGMLLSQGNLISIGCIAL